MIEVNSNMKFAITGAKRGIGKACADLFTADGHEVIGFSQSDGYDIRDPDIRKNIVEQSLDADVFINNASGYMPPGDKRLHQLPESEREVWDSEGYFPQTRMYMEIWEHFYNKTKAVVNINSSIKYSSTTPNARILVTEPRDLPFLVTDKTEWSEVDTLKSQQVYFKSKEQLFAVASALTGMGNSGGAKKLSKTQFVTDVLDKQEEIDSMKCRCININPGWVHTDMFPMFASGRKMLPEDIAEIIKWTLNMPKNIEVFDLAVRKKLSNKEIGLTKVGKDLSSIPPIKA